MNENAQAPEIEISEALLACKVCKGKDATASPVSIKIGAGEFFSILGPTNGQGSALLRIIAGLDSPKSGEVRISGKAAASVGFVFDEPALLDWRTAMGNVLLQSELRGLDLRESRAEAKRLFASLGISGCEDLKPAELPVGSAQRVAICRALVHRPSLLLLDNPTRILDGLDREQLTLDLQRLQLTPRMTVVLYTTTIDEAVLLSDRISVMGAAGSVIQTVAIELPRPRRMDKAMTPQIAEYSSSIRTILHAGGILS